MHALGLQTEKACRLSTWRAMVRVFQEGKARAIGVSNWNATHLQEIVDAGLPLPSVNQCPFNYYHSTAQQSLIDYCNQHDILFHGYSALGAPDVFTYPFQGTGMAWIQLDDPTVMRIAAAHKVSPAQALINWQATLGIPNNARSQNISHMRENLAAYDFTLSNDELKTLGAGPQAPTPTVRPARARPPMARYSWSS